jgi:hypothetical protein
MVGEFKVEVIKGKWDGDIKIGCKTILREQAQSILDLMNSEKFKEVSFDGHKISIELLRKILEVKYK